MLWYKNWLETRSKLLLALVYTVFPVALMVFMQHNNPIRTQGSVAMVQSAIGALAIYWAILPTFLAGSGIKTQTFRAQRGLHSSMFYTLSLPVSRRRLFLTRASLGIGELAALLLLVPVAVWIMFPALWPYLSHLDLLKYWLTVFACGMCFYSIGVLLLTFLDDLAQNFASMFSIVFLFAVLSESHMPAPVNLFRAMGPDSPLFTHTLPWTSMTTALATAVVLCTTALTIVCAREYN